MIKHVLTCGYNQRDFILSIIKRYHFLSIEWYIKIIYAEIGQCKNLVYLGHKNTIKKTERY